MANLRELARGEPCLIRVPMVCTHRVEETVLCHVRMIGQSGLGLKNLDLLGAWGCFACHTYVDANHPDSRLYLLEGMVRTQYQYIQRGIVRW